MMSPQDSRPSATSPDCPVDATRQLTRILDRMGDALAAMDVTALLAVEGDLGSALAAIDAGMHAGMQVADRAAARAAARQALTALLRCRRLGASFSDVASAMSRIGGAPAGYDCMGGYVERTVRSSIVVRA